MAKSETSRRIVDLLNVLLPAGLCATLGAFISVKVMARDVEHLQARTDRIETVANDTNVKLQEIAEDVAFIRGQMERKP